MEASKRLFFTYRTAHGPLTIGTCTSGVSQVVFGSEALRGHNAPSELANRTATELQEYFAGKRRSFDVPLAFEGSTFQQQVWSELIRVPYATCCTSADIAQRLGTPASFRAVGAAVRKNPLALLVPDHRIVDTTGSTRGTGPSAKLRSAFLELERTYAEAAGIDTITVS